MVIQQGGQHNPQVAKDPAEVDTLVMIDGRPVDTRK